MERAGYVALPALCSTGATWHGRLLLCTTRRATERRDRYVATADATQEEVGAS